MASKWPPGPIRNRFGDGFGRFLRGSWEGFGNVLWFALACIGCFGCLRFPFHCYSGFLGGLGRFFRFCGALVRIFGPLFFDFLTHLKPSCIFVAIFGDFSSIFRGFGLVLGDFGRIFDDF